MNNKRKWNQIAKKYSKLVSHFKNSVYHDELIPSVVEVIQTHSNGKKVLDVGCGDGYLSSLLDKSGYDVLGVDMTKELIKIAKSKYPGPRFLELNADVMIDNIHSKFDVIVSNFSLHSMTNKEAKNFLSNSKKLLKDDGLLVFSVAHPCFYLKSSQDYFIGKSKKLIVSRYRDICDFQKNIGYNVRFRHYHRPLDWYFNECFSSGYHSIGFHEVFDEKASIFNQIPFSVILIFKKGEA